MMEPTHGQNFRQQGPITHLPSENPIVCTGHKSVASWGRTVTTQDSWSRKQEV